jgi:hypothetical protein
MMMQTDDKSNISNLLDIKLEKVLLIEQSIKMDVVRSGEFDSIIKDMIVDIDNKEKLIFLKGYIIGRLTMRNDYAIELSMCKSMPEFIQVLDKISGA